MSVAATGGGGALVISLDFEIHWGVLERPADGAYRANLLGVPASVRGTLALFRELGIRATWATVGMLFARGRAELELFSPTARPRYAVPLPDPYAVDTGEGEADDPLHFAPSLIAEIAATPGQEVGTHTFAHLYPLEPGDGMREAFRADLRAARAIMRHATGIEPRSIVFPRNQHDPALHQVLVEEGVPCYRGNPRSWMWQAAPGARQGALRRAARLVDAYVGPSHLTRWDRVAHPDGTFNVPASFFVRPGSGALGARRMTSAMAAAARRGEIVHLWWHPHNFGVHTAERLGFLRGLLETFSRLRDSHGIESLGMHDVASRCGAAG